jgi:hypothetical protein
VSKRTTPTTQEEQEMQKVNLYVSVECVNTMDSHANKLTTERARRQTGRIKQASRSEAAEDLVAAGNAYRSTRGDIQDAARTFAIETKRSARKALECLLYSGLKAIGALPVGMRPVALLPAPKDDDSSNPAPHVAA